MLRRLAQYMKRKPGVWFATHEQIANHVKQMIGNYPTIVAIGECLHNEDKPSQLTTSPNILVVLGAAGTGAASNGLEFLEPRAWRQRLVGEGVG